MPTPGAQASRSSSKGSPTHGAGPQGPGCWRAGHRAMSHALPQCRAPTHTLELRLINTRLLFDHESPGDQARRGTPPAGACTDESPRPQEEPRSRGCGAQGAALRGLAPVPPSWAAKGLAPGLASTVIRANRCSQPQTHPLPFQICCAAYRGSHPSLVSPWAQRHPGSQHKDRGLRLPAAEKM